MDPMFDGMETRVQVLRLDVAGSPTDAARRGRTGAKEYTTVDEPLSEEPEPEVMVGELQNFTFQRLLRGQMGALPGAEALFIYVTPDDPARILKRGDLIVGEEVRPGVFEPRRWKVDDNIPKAHLSGGARLQHAVLRRNDDVVSGRT